MPRAPVAGVSSAGFTLLETMVAMAIFAGAAMALYGLFNTNLIALSRAHDISHQMTAVRHAAKYLSGINPHEAAKGQLRINGVDVFWSSRLLDPVRESQAATGERGYFEVGLYEVTFEAHDSGRSLGSWRIRVPGYKKVREPPP